MVLGKGLSWALHVIPTPHELVHEKASPGLGCAPEGWRVETEPMALLHWLCGSELKEQPSLPSFLLNTLQLSFK